MLTSHLPACFAKDNPRISVVVVMVQLIGIAFHCLAGRCASVVSCRMRQRATPLFLIELQARNPLVTGGGGGVRWRWEVEVGGGVAVGGGGGGGGRERIYY